jgi:hypothetical protein
MSIEDEEVQVEYRGKGREKGREKGQEMNRKVFLTLS